MKLLKALSRIQEISKITAKGNDTDFIITVKNDMCIHVHDKNLPNSGFFIKVEEWKNIKNSIDELLNKEI